MTVEPKPLEMSYEAFLEWADEDTPAEWVDGKVFLMSPPLTVIRTSLTFSPR